MTVKIQMDLLKAHGITQWNHLLQIAESVNAPLEQSGPSANRSADVLFTAPNGWIVNIFYDCGELDYIDKFIMPDGHEINFWDWPDNHPWKDILMAWQGCGGLERLMNLTDYSKLK